MAKPKKVTLSNESDTSKVAPASSAPTGSVYPPALDPANYTHSRQIVSAEKLASMSSGEILAVAADRGYRIGLGGRKVLARRFLDFQANDRSSDLHAPGALDIAEPLPEAEKLEEEAKAAELAKPATPVAPPS